MNPPNALQVSVVALARSSDRNYVLGRTLKGPSSLVFPEESRASAISSRALMSGLDSARRRTSESGGPSAPTFLLIGNDISLFRVVDSLASMLDRYALGGWSDSTPLNVLTDDAKLFALTEGDVGLRGGEGAHGVHGELVQLPFLGGRRTGRVANFAARVRVIRTPAFGHRKLRSLVEALRPDCVVISIPSEGSQLDSVVHDLITTLAAASDGSHQATRTIPPAIVIGASGAASRSVRDAVYYYDRVVRRLTFGSFPLGVVDVDRDSLDVIGGVASVSIPGRFRGGPKSAEDGADVLAATVETSLCIQNRPLAYAEILAQFAGLCFASLPASSTMPGERTLISFGRLRAINTSPCFLEEDGPPPIAGAVVTARAQLLDENFRRDPSYEEVVREVIVFGDCGSTDVGYEDRLSDAIGEVFGVRSSSSSRSGAQPLGVSAQGAHGDAPPIAPYDESYERNCLCPAIRACPLTAAQQWTQAWGSGSRRDDVARVARVFGFNPSHTASPRIKAHAPPSAAIELLLRDARSPGTLATAVNQLCLRRRTGTWIRKWRYNVGYAMTDSCASPTYSYDKVFGVLDRCERETDDAVRHADGCRASGYGPRAAWYPIDALLVQPLFGAEDEWIRYCVVLAQQLSLGQLCPFGDIARTYSVCAITENGRRSLLLVVADDWPIGELAERPGRSLAECLPGYPEEHMRGGLSELLLTHFREGGTPEVLWERVDQRARDARTEALDHIHQCTGGPE